ncbi:MAG: phosphoribosylformylglycinamidine synthase subunit PurQ [Planctomycetota bacterium]|jgi:phosphoribosylformylglycinamidine synthase
MSTPRVLVLRAPGINCERETFHAFQRAGALPEYVHIKKLAQEPALLDRFQILMVPGGFAYGDDIAAGRVLANEMRRKLGERLTRFVDRGGLCLGICNGFQILVKLGLLPRIGGGELRQEVTVTYNLSSHYECRWTTLRTVPNRCVFLADGLTLRFPAAHAEGYLMTRDEEQATLLREEGYQAFVYVDEQGEPTTTYPHNPNGSPHGIAGLTDVTGRVLGLMPHPDRAYLPHHMPGWRRDRLLDKGDGMVIFEAMVKAAQAEA